MDKAVAIFAALVFSICSFKTLTASNRVENGLIVSYDFDEVDGRTVHDRSGVGEALDLIIDRPGSVSWEDGKLSVVSPTKIVSYKSARKIVDALKQSNALSLEAWVTPATTDQTGPARIVSLSANPSFRNFTLGQDTDHFDVRLRTTKKDANGNPSTAAPAKSLAAKLTHIVFTRDAAGSAVITVDGQPVVTAAVGGDLTNWDASHRMTLANEVTGDRPWLGTLHLVAIYSRALSAEEVLQNYAAGESARTSTQLIAATGTTPKPMAALTDHPFVKEIQPLLAAHCIKCHGPEKQKGGLRLDQKTAAFKGGDSGEPSIVSKQSANSRIIQLVTATDAAERMPPESDALSPTQIELLRKWIDDGADWPDQLSSGATRAEMVITDEDRDHWSFRPLQTVTPPTVSDPLWNQTPVDQFVRHAQETKGLTPASPAEAVTLIRRVYFDLIGLPPVLEEHNGKLSEVRLGIEIDSTNLATDPKVFGKLIDQLLASPHYGERWARHWLDIARYADSDGMEGDGDRPNAYQFRDFVVRSLNDDLPYSTFVRWQLAGDEMVPDDPQAIAATGFIVAGSSTLLNVPMEEEKLRNRANELDDMVSTTAQALLGLTLACARCHDHKYDPLPTRDYYRMMCAFNGGDRTDVSLADPQTIKAHNTAMDAWQKEFNAAKKSRDDKFKRDPKTSEKDFLATLSADDQAAWKELNAAAQTIENRKPKPLPTAFAFADFAPEPRETWFFERGDFMARNERMRLGFVSVMTRDKTPEDYWDAAIETRRRDDSSQQRRAMAEWIADIDHGAGALLARVIVNRVWQHHFGEGLARTVSDFGMRGELPTHPELLEWLTAEFVRSGWSLKHLHRLIVNTATYRMAGTANDANHGIDPENRFLWHRLPQRLESEVFRDSMLAVAGTLNPEMFGPSFKPPIPTEAMQARNVKDPYPRDIAESPASRRRSIYMFHKRVVQYPLMLAFDAPDAQVSCGRRINTTVAPQALALLNDPFVRLRATELAKRLQSDAGDDTDAQIRRAFQLSLARPPAEDELTSARSFLTAQIAARKARDSNANDETVRQLAMTDFCQMVFSLNEFIYVD